MNPLCWCNKIIAACLPLSWQDRLGMLRRYRWNRGKAVPNSVVAIIDGNGFHGGLCDRWKGIVSLYAYCKATQRDFRLIYSFPFDLQDFQLPNTYDWRLSPAEHSHSFWRCRMLRVVGEQSFERLAQAPRYKQLHCYANRDWLEDINACYCTHYAWGELFQELFQPSPLVVQTLTSFEQWTSYPYIAVAFRMQNLLGDYPEYQYRPTSPEQQQNIMQCCLDFLQHVHEVWNGNILVTSDSQRMCECVSQLPFVFTNNAKAAHVDTINNAPQNEYLKSFVDFYLLAGAEKVICAGTEEMYPSDFPKYAALVHAIPFERVQICYTRNGELGYRTK